MTFEWLGGWCGDGQKGWKKCPDAEKKIGATTGRKVGAGDMGSEQGPRVMVIRGPDSEFMATDWTVEGPWAWVYGRRQVCRSAGARDGRNRAHEPSWFVGPIPGVGAIGR